MNMEYDAEQLSQINQARLGGQGRVVVRLTDEQAEQFQSIAERESTDKDANTAHIRKIKAAAEQPGFIGDIRRTILHTRRPVQELAASAGIEPRLLSDFRAGDADLSSNVLDRLIEALGLRLMQEIPRLMMVVESRHQPPAVGKSDEIKARNCAEFGVAKRERSRAPRTNSPLAGTADEQANAFSPCPASRWRVASVI